MFREDVEIDFNLESLISIKEVFEGEIEGLNIKIMGIVMDVICYDGDRVVMVWVSCSEEDCYVWIVCILFNFFKCFFYYLRF